MTDYSELKRLAEAATPGRNFDRLPMAGGGLKYECTGDDGSLVLKVDHKNDEWGFVGDNGQADEEFFLACAPSAVLALIAENETIKAQFDECARLFVDATEQACKAQRERDQLKAENEAIRAALEVAALAMWNSEANMDSEAAAVEEALANAAMSRGEKSGG